MNTGTFYHMFAAHKWMVRNSDTSGNWGAPVPDAAGEACSLPLHKNNPLDTDETTSACLHLALEPAQDLPRMLSYLLDDLACRRDLLDEADACPATWVGQ